MPNVLNVQNVTNFSELIKSCICQQEALKKKPQLSTTISGLFENLQYGYKPTPELLTYRVRKLAVQLSTLEHETLF